MEWKSGVEKLAEAAKQGATKTHQSLASALSIIIGCESEPTPEPEPGRGAEAAVATQAESSSAGHGARHDPDGHAAGRAALPEDAAGWQRLAAECFAGREASGRRAASERVQVRTR